MGGALLAGTGNGWLGAFATGSFNGQSGAITFPLQSRDFFADQVDVPVNSDWPVTAIAPTNADNTYPAVPIIAYDDTTEEARGLSDRVPSSVTHGVDPKVCILEVISKPSIAPGAVRTAGLKWYYRQELNNGALVAWQSIVLNDATLQANTNFQYFTQTLTIGSGVGQLNVTPGLMVQFMLSRINPTTGTELVGDLNVAEESKLTWAWIP